MSYSQKFPIEICVWPPFMYATVPYYAYYLACNWKMFCYFLFECRLYSDIVCVHHVLEKGATIVYPIILPNADHF